MEPSDEKSLSFTVYQATFVGYYNCNHHTVHHTRDLVLN